MSTLTRGRPRQLNNATESTLAAERVRRHALNVDDAAMLLEMLGLAKPAPAPAPSAPPRRTRAEEVVQAVAAADRLIHLRELRAQLGWPGVAVDVAASRAARAGQLTRPKPGWYGLPGRNYPTPDTRPCGTWTAYDHGCRCSDCRAVVAEESRRRRARYRAQRVKIAGRLVAVTAPRHGLSTAQTWGCQCDVCGSVPALQPETATRSPRRLQSLRRQHRLKLALSGPWYNEEARQAQEAAGVMANSLASVNDRFPLARPLFDFPPTDDVEDSASTPYGIRFFQSCGAVEDMTPPSYRYSGVLQMAVCEDDTNTPWIVEHMGTEPTTTGTSDGRHPRGEEFKIDGSHYQ